MQKNGCTQKNCPFKGVKSCEMTDCKYYTNETVKILPIGLACLFLLSVVIDDKPEEVSEE